MSLFEFVVVGMQRPVLDGFLSTAGAQMAQVAGHSLRRQHNLVKKSDKREINHLNSFIVHSIIFAVSLHKELNYVICLSRFRTRTG